MLLPACPARSPISRPVLSYYDKSLLGVIHSNGADLRGRIFGHPDPMLTLDKGFFAKFVGFGESTFYEVYQAELSSILPCDLIPEVVAIVFPTSDPDSFDLQRNMMVLPLERRRPMILQRDLVASYKRPSIIDFKIGSRSWRIGASPNKASRRAAKMAGSTCAQTFFRVRAAMWYSGQFDRVPGTAISCVSRKFGNTCTMAELRTLFRDFSDAAKRCRSSFRSSRGSRTP
jgi:hypothetical protein